VYRESDELETAIDEYERVLELDPENATAREWLEKLQQ
jgi:predicted TPR repeat methyltransferase